ncbi:MAG: hypothetical protein RL095_2967 [Verrucomicrobiota bacterium]|jgi:hypothetical protein
MILRILLLAALLGLACRSVPDDAVRRDQEAALERGVLPGLSLQNLNLPEALAQVELEIRAAGPGLRDFRIHPSPKLASQRFTLETEMPIGAGQALRWLCLISDSKLVWHRGAWILAPESEFFGPLETRQVKLPRGFVAALGTRAHCPDPSAPPSDPAEPSEDSAPPASPPPCARILQAQLAGFGLKFPPGSGLKITGEGVAITHEAAALARCQNTLEILRRLHYQGQGRLEPCPWLESSLPPLKLEPMEMEEVVSRVHKHIRKVHQISMILSLSSGWNSDPDAAPADPADPSSLPPVMMPEPMRSFDFPGGSVRDLLECLCDSYKLIFRCEGALLKLGERRIHCPCYMDRRWSILHQDFPALMRARLEWLGHPQVPKEELPARFVQSFGMEVVPGEELQFVAVVSRLVFTGTERHLAQMEWLTQVIGPPPVEGSQMPSRF